ncbi:uncharacterized protein PD653_1125 [Nocardioides sp. PD653]|nr:uncharacterized protein PD653B2_0286 [Nocardioides sp. PD653-B2]GAW53722.1 uncharacterized protein PD653_1125 [Nocardioides sp. PD653]
MVPESATKTRTADVDFLAIEDAPTTPLLCAFLSSDRSPATDLFLSFLNEERTRSDMPTGRPYPQ